MALTYSREALSDGIVLTSVTDERFKTNYITINLITNLSSDTAAVNAVIPFILSKSNSKYNTITELNKKLTSLYGSNISGDIFKIGDSQGISLSASCIADKYTFNGERITDELTDLLLDCLFSPYVENEQFYEKNFLLCKQELIDDIDADINDKRTYAVIRAGKTIYGDEPASITSHGDKQNAEKITAKTAYQQYLNLLKTSKIEILFTGGGNAEEFKNKILDIFKKYPRLYNNNVLSNKSKLKNEAVNVIENLDVIQSKMVMAFKSEIDNAPAVKLMNAVFGTTPFSKLFLNVREKLSLCYYCSSGYNEQKGVLIVDSGVEKENTEKAEKEIINQLKEMADGNFDESEIENSVLSIINNIRSVNDSPYALANWYLRQSYSGTNFTPEQEIERIRSVKKEDITKAAQSFVLDTVYVLTDKGE